jgi:hypothetical protein
LTRQKTAIKMTEGFLWWVTHREVEGQQILDEEEADHEEGEDEHLQSIFCTKISVETTISWNVHEQIFTP